MTKLTFYRQCRKDGAIRTGIEIDGETVLGRFETGSEREDSALDWFVDIRCSVNERLDSPEAARQWFLNHAGTIQNALEALAGELSVGMDFAPISRDVASEPNGAEMKIVCSAVRRVTAQEMAKVLKDIKEHWSQLVVGLPALEPV